MMTTRALLLVLASVAVTACGAARRGPSHQMGDEAAKARAVQDSLKYPYTKADIEFMTGMIHHHAQAILISKWAPNHGAGAEVIRLTERVINAQTDEIALMQTWLRDRNQSPPKVDAMGNIEMDHSAHGSHGADMPGMLSAEQLAQLDAARGAEFDRLFLTFMIQHHRGAILMVNKLFSVTGAGQDETIYKFASDVEADQGTEIKRMLTMLITHTGGTRTP